MARHKLFIDENLPPQIAPVVERMFQRQLWVRSFQQEGTKGMYDIPLVDHLKALDFHGIITSDFAQVDSNPDERNALREAGFHWIGVPKPKAKGIAQISQITAAVIAAMPQVLEEWPDDPTAFKIKSTSVSKASAPYSEPL